MKPLRVVIIKPSKYAVDGYVERFRWGYMPNSTVPHMRSMLAAMDGCEDIEVHAVDEYVYTSLDYLELLKSDKTVQTLVALVGVQSHQMHRALDLAAFARKHGSMAIIGGPHAMTCDTSSLQDCGVSFALAEAELIWPSVIADAKTGLLQPVYGQNQRWEQELNSPVIIPPSTRDLKRYISPLVGLYPARGCPFSCNFCSVIKIAGRRVRSQAVATTMQSLKAAQAAGVKIVMFTSDNFNKYTQAEELLNAMIAEKIDLRWFAQCDVQVAKQEPLLALMAKAGCNQIFLGVELFDRKTLLEAGKTQNRPERYQEIITHCRAHGIMAHFSNIIGFPGQNAQGAREHLEILQSFGPTHASFYVLCPIPGTEQYKEFRRDGLLTEPNLDRYDTTCLTWNHPLMTGDELSKALYDCYYRFYSPSHVTSQVKYLRRDKYFVPEAIALLGASPVVRTWARRGVHPMSGGMGRKRLDHVSDMIELRRATYGFELAPLPDNLELGPTEEALNKFLNPSAREANPRDLVMAG